jgi:hypothetical protein
MCNFTSTLLDELFAYVVSCWCTSRIVCACENDLSLASHTKLPSPCMLCTNAIREHMFCARYPKSISIHLEWHSCGIVRVVSLCIFYMIFHLENFRVITIGVPRLPMRHK